MTEQSGAAASGNDSLDVSFLEDGGQSASDVAARLTAFFDAAASTLDIAIYDCALTGDLATTVGASLRSAVGRNVAVRIAYYAGPHKSPIVPPPLGSSEAFLQTLDIEARPVHGYQALMHDKYVIRDGQSVWTGSMNWTADAWTREENVILQLQSSSLAGDYTRDFEELWGSGKVENTGGDAGGTDTLTYQGAQAATRVWFSPDSGIDMAHAVAAAISSASQRIVVASPVITDGPILGALADVLQAGNVPIRGVYDRTQMEEALQQWQGNGQSQWKVSAFESIARGAHLSSKSSTPYTPTSVHDYMHVKLVVADDVVFTGSYNFSHSGEENAENLLRIQNAAFADTCCAYIDRLIARYPPA